MTIGVSTWDNYKRGKPMTNVKTLNESLLGREGVMNVTYTKLLKLSDVSPYTRNAEWTEDVFNKPSGLDDYWYEIHLPEADTYIDDPREAVVGDINISYCWFNRDNNVIQSIKIEQAHTSLDYSFFVEKRRIIDRTGKTMMKTYLIISDLLLTVDATSELFISYSVFLRKQTLIPSTIILKDGYVKYIEDIPTTDKNLNPIIFHSEVKTGGLFKTSINLKENNETVILDYHLGDVTLSAEYYRIPLWHTAFEQGESNSNGFMTDIAFPTNLEIRWKSAVSQEDFGVDVYYHTSFYSFPLYQVKLEYISNSYVWVVYIHTLDKSVKSHYGYNYIDQLIVTYQNNVVLTDLLAKNSTSIIQAKQGKYNHSSTYAFFEKIEAERIYPIDRIATFFDGGANVQIWLPELSSQNKDDFEPVGMTPMALLKTSTTELTYVPSKTSRSWAWIQAQDYETGDWHWFLTCPSPRHRIQQYPSQITPEGIPIQVVYWTQKVMEDIFISYKIRDNRQSD